MRSIILEIKKSDIHLADHVQWWNKKGKNSTARDSTQTAESGSIQKAQEIRF